VKPIVFHDPPDGQRAHEYLTKVFFKGMRQWLRADGKAVTDDNVLEKIHNATVITSADYINAESIQILRNNDCKIVAFSCTDSSYIAQTCRPAAEMADIDLIFALTGIQKVNVGHEMVVDHDFNISLEKREFLPHDDWIVFNNMRKMGRLQSMPYVHWSQLPELPARSYNERSQKVLIRGGCHARRFILALMLMRKDLLDTNSGFVTAPYFADDMNPRFRYCEPCRKTYRSKKHFAWPENLRHFPHHGNAHEPSCTSPAQWGDALDWTTDLGKWNNACPRSFYWLSAQFQNRHGHIDTAALEKLLNAQWLPAQAHQEMLARITFTSDLKWLFSIYAAQRFWDAAAAGCINLLPYRTVDQEFFPAIENKVHYLTYNDDFSALEASASTVELEYEFVSQNARNLYNHWIKPGRFALNENLCHHIFEQIERHCT
jgi:hypothetical protein